MCRSQRARTCVAKWGKRATTHCLRIGSPAGSARTDWTLGPPDMTVCDWARGIRAADRFDLGGEQGVAPPRGSLHDYPAARMAG